MFAGSDRRNRGPYIPVGERVASAGLRRSKNFAKSNIRNVYSMSGGPVTSNAGERPFGTSARHGTGRNNHVPVPHFRRPRHDSAWVDVTQTGCRPVRDEAAPGQPCGMKRRVQGVDAQQCSPTGRHLRRESNSVKFGDRVNIVVWVQLACSR